LLLNQIEERNALKERLDIVYEDNHLLIINKPSGMLVQGDRTEDRCLIDIAKDYIKDKYKKPGNVFLGLVHRLDRPASGLVILAKTSKALTRMNEQFRIKTIHKIYWVITYTMLPSMEGKLVHWLIKDHQKNVVSVFTKEKGGSVKAELEYRILSSIQSLYLTEVTLITGRFHQIRAQLSAVGSPIVGDIKYGYKTPNVDKSICLHARKLEFKHPVKNEEMKLVAPVPSQSFWNIFKEQGM
jgi:23S rRNA pseudouridine1911/1915/1917 synthase